MRGGMTLDSRGTNWRRALARAHAVVAIVLLAALALADVNIPNGCPTGTGNQGGRTVTPSNDGTNVTITATSPELRADTSIHIWWWITPKGGGTGSGDSQKANSKEHKTQTTCTAKIPISAANNGATLHWVVAYDKWNPATEEHDWTWGTDGTMSL